MLAAMGNAALVDDDVRGAIKDVATDEAARHHERGRGTARWRVASPGRPSGCGVGCAEERSGLWRNCDCGSEWGCRGMEMGLSSDAAATTVKW